MSIRISGRVPALVAAVVLAVAGTLLVPAPAQAANNWETVYETARHVKAQACRTGTYTNPQGYRMEAIRWRGNAREATLGGAVQLHVRSDRFGTWRSSWQRVSAGRASSVRSTYFLAGESVKVKMRVRTTHGTSRWSSARRMGSLRRC